MEIKRKMKALNIELEEVSKELPKELDEWILNKYVSSGGWDCSGGAFESPDTFMIWVDLDSENDAKERVDLSDLGIINDIYKENNRDKNWIVFDYSISINTIVEQEK